MGLKLQAKIFLDCQYEFLWHFNFVPISCPAVSLCFAKVFELICFIWYI